MISLCAGCAALLAEQRDRIEESLALCASVFAAQISGEMMTTGSRTLFLTARVVVD